MGTCYTSARRRTVLASGMWTECTFGSGPHFASVLSHLGGSGHQNEIPCTHPPSPNPCDSEYDHFGACRTVSEAIGGLGRASPQGADAGEPLAIFCPSGILDHFSTFYEIRNQTLGMRNQESGAFLKVSERNDSSRVHFHTFHHFTIMIMHSFSVSLPPPTHTGVTLI